eukprot:m51a1_g2324 putative hybrid cluster protein (562) ;mRNA; f:505146-507148
MFCFQCEQTSKGVACTIHGVCQKNPDVAALQDNLMLTVQSIAVYANRDTSKIPRDIDLFVAKAIFLTLTNVNFDPEDHVAIIREAREVRDKVAKLVGPQSSLPPVATFEPGETMEEMIANARKSARIDRKFGPIGRDRACLQELCVYGIKGASAYLYHAMELGAGPSADVTRFFYRALASFHEHPDASVDELLRLCLDAGAANYRAMELLDAAHTETFGDPEPTEIEWVKDAKQGSSHSGKVVLISGHDLLALRRLMDRIEERGLVGKVFVYTHGEMMPANGYPKLHCAGGAPGAILAGHYGTAWQNQAREFDAFPGPVFMTTNCYVPAPVSYVGRMFMLGPVGGVNTKKVNDWNFDELLDMAQTMAGLPAAAAGSQCIRTTVGFGRKALLGAIPTLLEAVHRGELKRIVLIGGCDGYEKERNYFTDMAAALPKDALILTLACGRFKVNQMDYGMLGTTGIPRLLDVGQCNDTYSAIRAAVAIAEELGTDVNGVPLSLVVSWFEQKAVAVLLTLLYLGITDIYLGPRIPGFFTANILKILVDKFRVHAIGTVEKDLPSVMR